MIYTLGARRRHDSRSWRAAPIPPCFADCFAKRLCGRLVRKAMRKALREQVELVELCGPTTHTCKRPTRVRVYKYEYIKIQNYQNTKNIQKIQNNKLYKFDYF